MTEIELLNKLIEMQSETQFGTGTCIGMLIIIFIMLLLKRN